jgi:alpha-N-arabinofuranosidase
MRRDVVALLKRMSVNILRWPGGNFAGDYRWQDGLLPVDRRAPLASFMEMETLPHSHGFDTHEIGTDEYVALCREVGAEPFISINIGWESPELASAWVEYCNGGPRTKWGKVRASRGHREPFNVKYWSLGNEMGYTHMEGPNTPAAYAAKAVACARAMRKAGRRIVLVSSGFWSGNRWFKEALPLLWRDVDHLSHHYYTRSLTEHAGSAGRANFRSVVTRPAHVLEQLREIRRKMARRIPRRKFVGIAFDEWNVWYAWYRIPSVADGIHAASMLNMFCREAADVGMTIGCYFEPVNEGAILVEPDGARLTPAGEAFELYRAHRGNTLVRLDPQKPDADVDVTVSLNRRTKEVVATVVNRSPDKARAVALAFPGAEGLRVVEAVLLEGKDLLPASGFARKKLGVTVKNGRARMVLPKHSVTRLRFAPR